MGALVPVRKGGVYIIYSQVFARVERVPARLKRGGRIASFSDALLRSWRHWISSHALMSLGISLLLRCEARQAPHECEWK